MKKCALCKGKGKMDDADCELCDGTGEIRTATDDDTCPLCDGSGEIDGEPCPCTEDDDNSADDKGGKKHDYKSAKGDKGMKAAERTELIKSLTECPCSGFTKDDIKMLEGASDERLSAFKTAADTSAKAKKDADEKAAAPKTLTEADYLATLPESMRAVFLEDAARKTARKTELVEKLKTAQKAYTEDELKALSLETLERLGTIANIEPVEPQNFSTGRVIPMNRAAQSSENYDAPDGYATKEAAAK